MARPSGATLAVPAPSGHRAAGWLAALSAFIHYSEAEGIGTLSALKASHAVNGPLSADDAAEEAHSRLHELGLADTFEEWRNGPGIGTAGYWHTAELAATPAR
jgi:hypothetical protein